MVPGPYETVLETLDDLDAHLAGLEVSYSEENAEAAQRHLETLTQAIEGDPDELVALREAVEAVVEDEDPERVQEATAAIEGLRARIERLAEDAGDEE